MKTELFIGWRYFATKRKEKFISLISVVSVLGVAIGVAALIVVIAVMTGFDKDLREKIVGHYSHITIAGYDGISAEEYSRLQETLKSNPHILGMSPYVQGQVLIKEDKRFFAVGIRGIDPSTEKNVSKIQEYIISGNKGELPEDAVIVGKELALYFGLNLGSLITVYSPTAKQYPLRVTGIFHSGMYDYDMNAVFTHVKTAQVILGLNNRFSAVAVKLDNLYAAPAVKEELSNLLGFDYILKTWMEANQNFFAALKLEKLTMFVILTLIILVASFNIMSTIMVMVVEKTKDIGILKALGMQARYIRRIFTFVGLLIGVLGTALGLAGGVGLCALIKKYQFIKLPQDIYYIDRLPVSINAWPDIALIVLAAFLITLVSTVYPAQKAAKLKPVDALRYE